MNRELIVKLLKKNIDDLILLTDGFEEMTSYPRALIHLAQLKTNDIKEYLYELSEWKQDEPVALPDKEEIANEEVIQVVASEATEEDPDRTTGEIVVQEEKFSESNEEEELPREEQEDEKEEDDEEEEITPELTGNITFEVESTEPVQEEISADRLAINPSSFTMPVENTELLNIESDRAEIPEPLSFEMEVPVETPEPIAAESAVAAIDAAPVYTSDDKKPTLGERLASGITRNETHSASEADRLNNTLANKKIDDIRQAISIGDRFRFQRELFRNNGEEMNKMLNYINVLASYQEIETFLQKKYSWSDDNEAAKDLYAIVRRKFL
jgi:hypothetical protein